MEKQIAAALADELLDTVIHKFQIPGSGVQVKVQAVAIKELMKTLGDDDGIHFPKGTSELVDLVAGQMPACFGGVPQDFYTLRHAIEYPFNEDPFLRHVVNVEPIRGTRDDLYYLIPVLKDPGVPEALKESFMDHSIMALPDSGTMESVKVLVEELGGENKEKLLAQIAPHVDVGKQGDQIREIITAGNFEDLQNVEMDTLGMMEVSARADTVLYQLYRHWLSKFYDEGG